MKPCPQCGGTTTVVTGVILSGPIWADPYSTTGELHRRKSLGTFVACDCCEWVEKKGVAK